MGEADEPRRRHIVLTGRDQDLGAQHAAKARPVDEHDGENDADHPGAEPGHQHERQDDGRKGHPHIDGASDQPIHPAAEIAREMGEGLAPMSIAPSEAATATVMATRAPKRRRERMSVQANSVPRR